MLEKIQKLYAEIEYDFRVSANLDDPLKHLFPEWVEYYRLKAAIAAALRPQTILEIGVRFGYSAAAFLHGSPKAHYTGIDADTPVSGGHPGAMEWARKMLPAGQFELIRGDSQSMPRFPRERYDLIHVDGQQDGDGTYRDLEKALRQSRYVLVDGYLWTDSNFQAANACLYAHRDKINWSLTLGGYAGELLIEVKSTPETESSNHTVENSLQIRDSYDRKYYLTNCGGWDKFVTNRGRSLSDPRLTTMLDLALMQRPSRLLDLGCGRGEITRQAARQGCLVDAVDYSADAIAIAREALGEESELLERVRFHCADASKIELDQPIDAAVAGDIVEHLSPFELDEMYRRVAASLTQKGLFIVHTAPSLWFYEYHYIRQRRDAAKLGLYLPPDPRTEYERKMHINEQSPRVLAHQLRQHFPHVLLWFAGPEDPSGSLKARMRPRELAAQRDLYALASHSPIDRASILELFISRHLDESEIKEIGLKSAERGRLSLLPGERCFLPVELKNESSRLLASQLPNPVRFAYHWVNDSDNSMVLLNGERSNVSPACPPHTTQTYYPEFVTPNVPGEYRLQMTLLQEGVRWFDWSNPDSVAEVPVQVRSR